MHNTTTTPRPRAVRRLAVTGAGALVLAALPAGVANAHGSREWDGGGRGDGEVWFVGPGESIQAAVDRAGSGDTIQLAPGEYTEAVCIDGKGLTVVGAGRDDTSIVWPEWSDPSQLPDVPAGNPCWDAQEAVDQEDDPGTRADNVSALFFRNPDSPVEVRGLQTRNHPASGILAWGAQGFSVEDTGGFGHDRYGILAVDTTDVRVHGNVEIGLDRGTATEPNAGTAGISVGDVEDAGAHISHNYVEGYNLGIFLRESSGGHVTGNELTGNCIGLLLFDDVATEVPDAGRNVEAGDYRISWNESTANNRYCLQGREGDQHVSGVGMQVVNADGVTVEGNSIRDNDPTLPEGVPFLTNPAGGLTLFSLPPFNAPEGTPPAGPVDDITVVGNDFGDNRTLLPPENARFEMDVFVGYPSPQTPFMPPGEDLDFHGNACDASVPPSVCGEPYPVQ